MSDFSGPRQSRPADYGNWLQATMLTGVVLLAVAAFLLSYAGIRAIAVAGRVPPARAGLYPLILDAALVVACLAALGLRGANRWMQGFAWLSIMILLAVMAVVEAMHAAGISLLQKPAAAAMAALPWALLLLVFGLWLSIMRYLRTVRVNTPRREPVNGPVSTTAPLGAVVNERSARWAVVPNADPDGPDVRLLPPQPGPAVTDADPDGPDVRLLPPQPGPAVTDADPDGPDVRLLPPQPGPAVTDADPDGPDVRLLPPQPGPAVTDADPDGPDVRLLPPQPGPAVTDADPDGPDVRLLPPQPSE